MEPRSAKYAVEVDKSKIDIVVIGSVNVNLYSYADNMPSTGEQVIGTKFAIGYGGRCGNISVAAAKLGASVAVIGRLGNDNFGKEYVTKLKALNINTSHLVLTEGEATGIATVIVNKGKPTTVVVPGANGLLSLKDLDVARPLCKNVKVAIASYETAFDTTFAALKMFKEENVNCIIFVPVFGAPDKKFFEYSDIVVMNDRQLENLTGEEVTNMADAKNLLKKILLLYEGLDTAIVTLGSWGALYLTRSDLENPIRVMVRPVDKPIDTTGAGEAFIGSLAFCIAKYVEMSFEEQVTIACELARDVVMVGGTQESYPCAKEASRILKSHHSSISRRPT